MKKFIAMLLALTMALSMVGTAWAEGTLSGSGTEADPYEVSSEADLTAAIAEGGEITLGSNIALTNGVAIAAGAKVVLNLNGKNLSYTTGHAGSTALIANNGTLTINGPGTITNVATNPDSNWEPEGFPTYANNTITNCGILVVNGATIENGTSGSGAYYAIDNNSGNRDAVATINSGVVTCTNNVAIRHFANSTTYKNEVNIVGGDVIGTRAVWIQLPSSNNAHLQKAELNVSGGNLSATGSNNLAIYSYSFGASYTETKINISGGNFKGDVAIGGGTSYGGTGSETLNITAGNFDGTVYTYNDDTTDTAGKINISGGTFTEAPDEKYVAAGYAVFEIDEGGYLVAKSCNVTFDANGGSNELTMDPIPVGQFTLPTEHPFTRDGYTFKGWATSKEATEVLGATYDVTGDITFYAVWEENAPAGGEDEGDEPGYVPEQDPVLNEEVKDEEISNVVSNEMKDAVQSEDNSNTNTVTATTPVEGDANATTTIEFNDDGDNGAAAKEKFATATDIDTKLTAVDETVTEKVTTAVEEKVSDDAEIAAYVDIDIQVLADGEHVGNITELPKPIKVVIPASALEFEDLASGYKRQVYVLRFHGDDVTKLRATQESNGDISFYSDKFSTYAVVYEDTKTYGGWGGYYTDTTTETEKKDDVTSPDTFDAGIAVSVAVSVLGATGGAWLLRKKED